MPPAGPLLLLTTMLLVCGPAAGKQPNILFIFADDHARRAISVYGSDLAEIAPTPNIDRLAGAGAQLRHSFCANSLCGPV